MKEYHRGQEWRNKPKESGLLNPIQHYHAMIKNKLKTPPWANLYEWTGYCDPIKSFYWSCDQCQLKEVVETSELSEQKLTAHRKQHHKGGLVGCFGMSLDHSMCYHIEDELNQAVKAKEELNKQESFAIYTQELFLAYRG